MLNKNDLHEYIECKANLEHYKLELKAKRETFESENIELIDHINVTQEQLENHKAIITGHAKEEYEATDNKKLLGNIGIRIVKILAYEANEALSWAKKHDMALCLDKKVFEKIAKTNPLPFVDISEGITVTFPKEIVFEEKKKIKQAYPGLAQREK